jgi:DNA invertase Pin-like site-specific DNA recombinase
MITRLVEGAGAKVHSAEGASNGDAPEDFMSRGIMDVFAGYERLVIRARTKAALAVKKSRGERTGQVPYGWRATDASPAKLEPVPQEQAIIRRIRAMHRKTSTRAIAEQLNAEDVPARGARWHQTTVVRVLRRSEA